jgi:acetyl esterase/lipase
VRRLHPQAETLRRERLAAGVRPVHELSVAEAREAERSQLEPTDAEPVAEVVDLVLPGPAGEITARFYLPDGARPRPVLVYFHGGGWVLGSLEAADGVCRRLANAAECAVVSVAYRRAPEYPFPAGLEDCYAATCWIAEHGAEHGLDESTIAVGGASAGGNLAAAVTQLVRERRGPPLVCQLLVYPPLDHRAATASMRERQPRPFFSSADVAWCWGHYIADRADGESPLASPLRSLDLRGLPPALVVTAELDPLRDEAELYAARLRAANVPTQLVRFDGVMHGFFSLSDRLDAAAEAQALAASALRKAFARAEARI